MTWARGGLVVGPLAGPWWRARGGHAVGLAGGARIGKWVVFFRMSKVRATRATASQPQLYSNTSPSKLVTPEHDKHADPLIPIHDHSMARGITGSLVIQQMHVLEAHPLAHSTRTILDIHGKHEHLLTRRSNKRHGLRRIQTVP